jgi:beta-glucanase (GH16 family)
VRRPLLLFLLAAGVALATAGAASPEPPSDLCSKNPTHPKCPPPVNTALPTISGTPTAGQTLQGSTGTWTNSPTSYARQWLRCDTAGANCVAIAGATSASYLLASADVGKTIRVRVTATNAAGSASAQSAQTAVVGAAAPGLIWSDEFSGTALDATKWWVTPWCSTTTSQFGAGRFDPGNVFLNGAGQLVLRAERAQPGNCAPAADRPYDFAQVQTFREGSWPPPEVKADFAPPVRVEARIDFAPAAGLWQTLWLSSNSGPQSVEHLELDIQEYRPYYSQGQFCAVHHWKDGVHIENKTNLFQTGMDLRSGYHVYWMEYRIGSVKFGVDGLTCAQWTIANFSPKMMIRLFNVVGLPGTFGGIGGPPTDSLLPADMLVDWVRVYSLPS